MGNVCIKLPCYKSKTLSYKDSGKIPLDLDIGDVKKYVPNITEGLVVKVYDGDTITIAGRVQYNPTIYKFSVRILGIDTPEMKTKDENEKEIAKLARDHVHNIVYKKIVQLHDVSLDKYGRLLAHVTYNNKDIATSLIENRLAVEYDGGTKHCPSNWKDFHENRC